MTQTFKTKFDQLGPERRAQIVFGIDKMHRQHVASKGDFSTMPYDVAEYLRDAATIHAYLELVKKTEDAALILQARADAIRAREMHKEIAVRNAPQPSQKLQSQSLPSYERKGTSQAPRFDPAVSRARGLHQLNSPNDISAAFRQRGG